jgi:hypothetical protein
MDAPSPPPTLYVFIDEGGNLDFTPKGTKYFTLTALSKFRPFSAAKQLYDLKYDLIEKGICLDRFHATEDKQHIRDQVFQIISQNLEGCRFDSVIVEKSKTFPPLRTDDKFYPKVLGFLLKYVLEQHQKAGINRVIVITDTLPLKRNRNAIEKAAKSVLSNLVKSHSITSYELLHHTSYSSFDLQIVDYANWAIYRRWENDDNRSLQHIRKAVCSQYDIFCNGTQHHYQR